MKPIIILPPKAVSDEDIKLLRDNELCVVVAENPALVKFVDPIPSASQRTKIEDAAIALSRKLLNGQWQGYDNANCIGRSTMSRMFIDILMQGTPLDSNPQPTKQEIEQSLFDAEKRSELTRLAKEEARAERAAKKAGK